MRRLFKRKQHQNPEAPEWWKEYREATLSINRKDDVKNHHFTVLDVEATGLDVHQDRIISFASIPIEDLEIVPSGSFQCLVRQEYFDKDSVPIHELRLTDIDQGYSEEDLLENIIPLIGGSVIVGHHIGYDVAMINKALERNYGLKLLNLTLETGTLHKKAYPSKYRHEIYRSPPPSLDTLAAQFGLEFHDRHSAMGDSIMTALIFLKLISILRGKKKLTLRDLL